MSLISGRCRKAGFLFVSSIAPAILENSFSCALGMYKDKELIDVAIIGAGPAGSFLAYCLVRSGLKVVVVDKEIFPRRKVCAGGLPPKVMTVLPFDVTPVIEKRIARVALTHKLREGFSRTYACRCYIRSTGSDLTTFWSKRRGMKVPASWKDAGRGDSFRGEIRDPDGLSIELRHWK